MMCDGENGQGKKRLIYSPKSACVLVLSKRLSISCRIKLYWTTMDSKPESLKNLTRFSMSATAPPLGAGIV